MGCCNSLASDQERAFICKKMAKEMMLVCVPAVLSDPNKVTIPLPPAFNSLKEASAKLKESAENCKGAETQETKDDAAEDKGEAANAEEGKEEGTEEKKGGLMGAMGGMLGSAVTTVVEGTQKVVEKGAQLAAEGVAQGYLTAAKALDAPIATVEGKLASVAKDILVSEEGKAKVSKVFSSHIVTAGVDNSELMCQGMLTGTLNEEEITLYLIRKAENHLITQLLSEIDKVLDEHTAIKAWNEAIIQYNKAVDVISKIPKMVAPSKIELNIKQYICECTVKTLQDLIGAEEKKLRKEPGLATSVDNKDIFIKVFTDTKTLSKDDYSKVGGL